MMASSEDVAVSEVAETSTAAALFELSVRVGLSGSSEINETRPIRPWIASIARVLSPARGTATIVPCAATAFGAVPPDDASSRAPDTATQEPNDTAKKTNVAVAHLIPTPPPIETAPRK